MLVRRFFGHLSSLHIIIILIVAFMVGLGLRVSEKKTSSHEVYSVVHNTRLSFCRVRGSLFKPQSDDLPHP